jgi:hypothetical protein
MHWARENGNAAIYRGGVRNERGTEAASAKTPAGGIEPPTTKLKAWRSTT